jgi:DsbC/DsbD-like thiol-disulfide interchange protein
LSLSLWPALGAGARAEAAASRWAEGYNNKARLLAGEAKLAGAASPVLAGIEIVMPPGWKTYWRTPGDAGGVPPSFDWAGSTNLASARVRFPAPHRLVDKNGATLGYKDRVVLPVEVRPQDPAKPVVLKLKAEYGVCKDICVPAEAQLEIEVKSGDGLPPEITDALALVPQSSPRPGIDPVLSKWSLGGTVAKPVLRLEVLDPGGAGGDAFLEAPDGLYVPVPKKLAEESGKATYEVSLSDGVDFKALKGQNLTVTLTGTKGQSETIIKLD